MRTFSRLILVTVVIALITLPTFAQPLADKVPANSLFYFGWRGSEDLGPAYADSHLKAILDQSNIPAVFSDMVPRAVFRVSRDNPQIGNVLKSITSVAGPMWRHPCAFFVADLTFQEKEPQVMPHIGVLCQAGTDAPQILGELQKLIEQMPSHQSVPIRAYQSGDIVAFTIGYAEDEDAVALAAAKSLKSDAGFSAAMNQVQKDSVLALYINIEHVWTQIDAIVEQSKDAKAIEYWPRIREASGLTSFKRLVATAAFDGKDWMEQAYLEAPTPHTGLASMLDAQPLSDDLLKLAPMDSDRVMAGTFDLAKFIATIRAGVAQVDPEAGQMVEKVIGAISLYVGRDFEKDVLAPIGEHWLCYSSPTIAGRGLLGSILINQLNDPKKAASGILATQIATFNTISPFLSRFQVTLRGQNMKAGDLSINYIAVPLVSPAWSVKGQNLYVSLYPQNIISADRFAASGGKSILDNPNFAALRQRLGAPSKVTGVSYTDLTQTVGEGYQGAIAMSRLVLGMGDIFGVRSPEPVIPPLYVLLQHVGPSGGVSWVDETGWHSKAVSSFPGAEIFSGGNNAAISMIGQIFPMLGALAPALGHARAQAVQVQDMSNLRQVSLACVMYANDHKGVLPASLDELVDYTKDPRVFVSAEHRDAAEAIRNQPKDAIAAWVSQNSDYEYVGNGQKLRTIKMPSQKVLAYQKHPDEQGRLAVAFTDGHVESVEAGALQGLLNR